MSFTVNGQTWTPQTTTQHAINMLDTMNANLQSLGLDQVVASNANAIWLILLAVGQKEADQDNVLVQAFNSFNISIADDAQISNLLPAAGTSLIPGAYTQATLTVYAGSGSVVVPSGTLAPYGNVNFATTSGITVPASGVGTVTAICTTIGEIPLPANGITSFTTNIANLHSVTNLTAGITGRNTETQNQARQRLIYGNTISWNIDGVMRALQSISGITAAQVYFNVDTVNNMTLQGGTIVPPRHARIVVAGSDPTGLAIASNYFNLMTAPTDGASTQYYTTLAGQVIPVNYDTAGSQNIYVKVYYDSTKPTQAGFATSITTLLTALVFGIGATVTQEEINVALNGFQYATITGSEVSSNGITYGRKVTANGLSVPVVYSVTVVAE